MFDGKATNDTEDKKHLEVFDDRKGDDKLKNYEVIEVDKKYPQFVDDIKSLSISRMLNTMKNLIVQGKIDNLERSINSLDSTDVSNKLMIAEFRYMQSELKNLQYNLSSENQSN